MTTEEWFIPSATFPNLPLLTVEQKETAALVCTSKCACYKVSRIPCTQQVSTVAAICTSILPNIILWLYPRQYHAVRLPLLIIISISVISSFGLRYNR